MTDDDEDPKPKAKSKKPAFVPAIRNESRRCDGGAMNWNGDCLACDSPKGGKCKAPIKPLTKVASK